MFFFPLSAFTYKILGRWKKNFDMCIKMRVSRWGKIVRVFNANEILQGKKKLNIANVSWGRKLFGPSFL